MSDLGSFANAQLVDVAGGEQPGGSLLVEARPQASLDGPWSLSVLSPSGNPFQLAHARGRFAGAVSPNGRFLTWSGGACRNLTLSVVDTGGSSPTARTLPVPGAFAKAAVQAINVSSSGQVAALVSTYDPEQCLRLGVSSAPLGTRFAVLSAAPGATSPSVVASVTDAVRAPTFAGIADIGFLAASADASTFTLCASPRYAARRAELIDVSNRTRFAVHRAAVRTSSRVAGIECAAANSGAAMMMTFVTHGQSYLVTAGTGSPRTPRRVALSFPSMSPSGRQVFGDGAADRPVIVDLATLHTTTLPTPSRWGSFLGLASGERFFEPETEGVGQSPVMWPTPNTILAVPGDRLAILNPITRKWSRPSGGVVRFSWTVCPLPTGRTLLAKGLGDPGNYQLYMTNPGSAQLIAVNSDQLGAIHEVSCSPHGETVYLSVGAVPATVYAVSGAAIDGSPLTR